MNDIKLFFENKKDYKLIVITRKEYEVRYNTLCLLEDLLKRYNINEEMCIINCIGLIPQRCVNQEEYYIINSIFPQYLWKICEKYKSRMIQPTTDCVFSGKRGNYTEEDEHDDVGIYGISKSLGEPKDATVIRTSIIGEEQYNKCSFLEFVKNNNILNGWENHIWNGITCYQYCKVIDKIISENLFWSGIRHICSPTSVTKYELANMIKEVYKLENNIVRYMAHERVDKTLQSIYEENRLLNISDLKNQIEEQKLFLESIQFKENE
jgi:dTDP-4-dehydrorhamnose reductase